MTAKDLTRRRQLVRSSVSLFDGEKLGRSKKQSLEILPPSTQRLDALITELRLSRAEFGKSIGLSESGVGHIFSRQKAVPTIWAFAIEAQYQISSKWLLEGKGPKEKSQKLTELQRLKLRLSADFKPELIWEIFEELLRSQLLRRVRFGSDPIGNDFEIYSREVFRLTSSPQWLKKYHQRVRNFEELLLQTKQAFLLAANDTPLDSDDQLLLFSILLDAVEVTDEMLSPETLVYAQQLASEEGVKEYLAKLKSFADLRYKIADFFKPPLELKKEYVTAINQERREQEEDRINHSRDGRQLLSLSPFLKLTEREEVVEDRKRHEIFRKKIEIAQWQSRFEEGSVSKKGVAQRLESLEKELQMMMNQWKKESSDGIRS